MNEMQTLLIELDKLKAVYRRSYISDKSRNENSAEHSWHLATALLAFKGILPNEIRLDHAIRMALVHDICEIGAGDISIYDAARSQKTLAESAYIEAFAAQFGGFGSEVAALWHEYEAQNTLESIWVRIIDRLLPFLLNLSTEGKLWQEQRIRKSQVLMVNKAVIENAPELGQWMINEIEIAVKKGWLQAT